MDIAGVRGKVARAAAALLRPRAASGMHELAVELAAAIRARPHPPTGVRELGAALCEEMGARRGGRPVELRFERFPDAFEVTGLWVEFHDFDLVIVEERAEAVQQLVILGHELWHLHAGHRDQHTARAAAADALVRKPGWRDAVLTVAARDGSREREEAEADEFGHRLAAAFRPLLSGGRKTGSAGTAGVTPDPVQRVQRSLGYQGRGGGVPC
ncbi:MULTISPECIES: toxin-antitoxin system, toxin component family protein [Streptomyces]|uniref:Toxin-antitoxin system, toxin component family protein n=2 Tax=Streptomyces TaxID=1883 RepID=A0ABV9IEN8_9ACTN